MAKKNQDKTEAVEPVTTPGKKAAPTRSRKEAQAANQRPLVPTDRKMARQLDKKKRDEAFARERKALETGDERYLPARDKGKIRRYVRDWVDARWSISEFLLPAMLLFLAGVLGLSLIKINERTANVIILSLMALFYTMLLVSVIEATVVWQRMKRRLKRLYPNDPIPRGTWFYMYTRMVMARRWRSPKPQVARGQFPDPDGSRAAAKAAKQAKKDS